VKWVNAGLLVLLLLLQARLWIGEGSIKEATALKKAIAQHQNTTAQLRERNQRLEAEVKDLKNQLGALEERARTDLGMIKQGETFYQFSERNGT
jgi:cell division protein FtsB